MQHLPTVLHFAALLTDATFRVSVAGDNCQVIECDGVGAKAAEPPPVGEGIRATTGSTVLSISTAAVIAAAC